MNQQYKNRRRRYFIDKDYQTKFILKFCLLVLAGLVVATGLVFVFSYGTVTTYFEHGRLIMKKTAFAILPTVILTNTISLILVLLATIVVVLFISHKIAGPMFRFEKEVEKITDGDLTSKIFLRKADQFTKMGERLNMMISALHGRIVAIQVQIEDLEKAAADEKAGPKVTEKIENIKSYLEAEFKI